jgi:hypothetical protein
MLIANIFGEIAIDFGEMSFGEMYRNQNADNADY